jgi:hypothetical protein
MTNNVPISEQVFCVPRIDKLPAQEWTNEVLVKMAIDKLAYFYKLSWITNDNVFSWKNFIEFDHWKLFLTSIDATLCFDDNDVEIWLSVNHHIEPNWSRYPYLQYNSRRSIPISHLKDQKIESIDFITLSNKKVILSTVINFLSSKKGYCDYSDRKTLWGFKSVPITTELIGKIQYFLDEAEKICVNRTSTTPVNMSIFRTKSKLESVMG